MLKKEDIVHLFKVQKRMLQRWQDANDYRYMIFAYLMESDREAIEKFFNEKYENDMIRYEHKSNFMDQVKEHLSEEIEKEYTILSIMNEEIFQIPEKKDQKQSDLYFFAMEKIESNNELEKNIYYVELCNRIVDTKALHIKIKQLKNHLLDGYKLSEMIFLTAEKSEPKYIQMNQCVDKDAGYCIDNVRIRNINIDKFSQDHLSIHKMVFIPESMDIEKVQNNDSYDYQCSNKELFEKKQEDFQNHTDSLSKTTSSNSIPSSSERDAEDKNIEVSTPDSIDVNKYSRAEIDKLIDKLIYFPGIDVYAKVEELQKLYIEYADMEVDLGIELTEEDYDEESEIAIENKAQELEKIKLSLSKTTSSNSIPSNLERDREDENVEVLTLDSIDISKYSHAEIHKLMDKLIGYVDMDLHAKYIQEAYKLIRSVEGYGRPKKYHQETQPYVK